MFSPTRRGCKFWYNWLIVFEGKEGEKIIYDLAGHVCGVFFYLLCYSLSAVLELLYQHFLLAWSVTVIMSPDHVMSWLALQLKSAPANILAHKIHFYDMSSILVFNILDTTDIYNKPSPDRNCNLHWYHKCAQWWSPMLKVLLPSHMMQSKASNSLSLGLAFRIDEKRLEPYFSIFFLESPKDFDISVCTNDCSKSSWKYQAA